jgi:hypothetical protein
MSVLQATANGPLVPKYMPARKAGWQADRRRQPPRKNHSLPKKAKLGTGRVLRTLQKGGPVTSKIGQPRGGNSNNTVPANKKQHYWTSVLVLHVLDHSFPDIHPTPH